MAVADGNKTMSAPPFGSLSPMLLADGRYPFSDPAWLFELKHDGYRVLASVDAGVARLRTRNGADCTGWFPEVASSLAEIGGGPHILDGEVCVLDDLGRSDFERLQDRARRRRYVLGGDEVVYCAFDLLVHAGKDVMAEPVERRKALLEKIVAGRPSLLYVGHVEGEGEWLYQQALALRLEGIVAKRKGSTYQPGARSRDWLKIKRPGAVPAERFRRA